MEVIGDPGDHGSPVREGFRPGVELGDEVWKTLLITAGVVVCVIFLFLGGFIVAFAVTFGLFWVMQALIGVEGALDKDASRRVVDFVRLKRDSEPEVKKRQLPKKQKPQEPPPLPVYDPRKRALSEPIEFISNFFTEPPGRSSDERLHVPAVQPAVVATQGSQ